MNPCATALYGRDYQTLNVTRKPGTQGVDTRRRTASFNHKKAVKLLQMIANSVVSWTLFHNAILFIDTSNHAEWKFIFRDNC